MEAGLRHRVGPLAEVVIGHPSNVGRGGKRANRSEKVVLRLVAHCITGEMRRTRQSGETRHDGRVWLTVQLGVVGCSGLRESKCSCVFLFFFPAKIRPEQPENSDCLRVGGACNISTPLAGSWLH